MKNGSTYIAIVERSELIAGSWSPGYYRYDESNNKLSDFVIIQRVEGKRTKSQGARHNPIEYKDIPSGILLTFSLSARSATNQIFNYPFAREQSLLFGTMRAYLGNVIVTPKSSWLGAEESIFGVKSEFLEVIPNDGLVYFWWSYLKSPSFLSLLPAGDGGTRPRASAEALLNTPATVPPLDERRKINEKLLFLAEQAWTNYIQCLDLVRNHEHHPGAY